MAGVGEREAESDSSRSLTSGSGWFTEEMLSAASAAYYDDGKAWTQERMRSALQAIAPMVTKWVGDLQASEGELMREAGHRAGYAKGYSRGCAETEEAYDL